MIKIVIPIIPTGKMAQRVSAVLTNEQKERIRMGYSDVHPKPLAYKCNKQRSREAALGAFIAPHVNADSSLTGPLRLTMGAFLPISKSWSKKKKQQAVDGEVMPTVQPDLTNLLKQVEDVCQGMGLIENDKYICEIVARKQYSDRPRWEFSFEPI